MTSKDKRHKRESEGTKRGPRQKTSKPLYSEEFSTKVNLAADPVVPFMTKEELQRAINASRADMLKAAKDMEFIEAARLRDEIIKMEKRLEEMD